MGAELIDRYCGATGLGLVHFGVVCVPVGVIMFQVAV